MNVEYINPFVTTAFQVFETVLGNKPEKGVLQMLPQTFTSQPCNVVIGVVGQLKGSVIYGMSLHTADKIASTMIGQPIKTFDQLAASAIAELGNMLGGHALMDLAKHNFTCDLTPPTVIRGSNVRMSTVSIPAVVIPMRLTQGEVHITVGLQERK